jgi:hypothetical protein
MSTWINKKTILSASGVIILGALGSAFWENILKPFAPLFFHFLLSVSILGLEVFKNNIYLEIAKGLHERPSLELFSMALGVLAGIGFGITFGLIRGSRSKSDVTESIINPLRSRGLTLSLALFLAAGMTISFVQATYENKAVTYYKQLVAIVGPDISSAQILDFDSRFAQIRTRQDFVSIIDELKKISLDHGRTLPSFGFVF